ncbi:RidA family protein [Spirosoma gilvum]
MNYFRNVLIWLALASCSQAQTPALPKVPMGYLYKVEPGIPGKIVYICGQRPFNDAGELVGPSNLTAQTRQVFENIKKSLATVDMTLKDITQITYSVKEATGTTQVSSVNAQSVKAVEASYFAQSPKLVEQKGVSQTVREDVLIEIEVIAVK